MANRTTRRRVPIRFEIFFLRPREQLSSQSKEDRFIVFISFSSTPEKRAFEFKNNFVFFALIYFQTFFSAVKILLRITRSLKTNNAKCHWHDGARAITSNTKHEK